MTIAMRSLWMTGIGAISESIIPTIWICRISYKMPLGRLGLEKGDKFKYLFDFGDEWRFQCRVMQELEEKTRYFRVIKAVGDPPAQYPDWDDEEL